jgi:hypothetical protein
MAEMGQTRRKSSGSVVNLYSQYPEKRTRFSELSILLDVIPGPLDFKFGCEGERLSGEWRHDKSRSDIPIKVYSAICVWRNLYAHSRSRGEGLNEQHFRPTICQ